MRVFDILLSIIIANLLVALAYIFFSPAAHNPVLSADNVLQAILNLPEYWFEGAKRIPIELPKLPELLMKTPKALIYLPIFWAALIGVLLSLYLLLMWVFSSRASKIIMAFLIIMAANVILLECILAPIKI